MKKIKPSQHRGMRRGISAAGGGISKYQAWRGNGGGGSMASGAASSGGRWHRASVGINHKPIRKSKQQMGICRHAAAASIAAA